MKFGRFVPVYSPEGEGGAGGDPAGGDPGTGGADGGAGIPEGVPSQFWDTQSNSVNLPEFAKSYGELSAFKAEHDARLAQVPAKPEDYKFEIAPPEGLELPEGFEWKVDPKDPRISDVREFAAKHKMTQADLAELLNLHMKFEIESHKAADAELQAEMKKLGSNGPARVKALETFLGAHLSKAEYESLRPVLGNAEAFSAVEKLASKVTTQRIPGNGEGGDPPKTPPTKAVRPADLFYGQRS